MIWTFLNLTQVELDPAEHGAAFSGYLISNSEPTG